MSDEYIYTSAFILMVMNVLGFVIVPFMFGEDRGKFTPADWLLKLVLFFLFTLPVLLYVIKHLN